MLQVSYLRDNKDLVLQGLAKRNFKQSSLVDDAIRHDEKNTSLTWTRILPK